MEGDDIIGRRVLLVIFSDDRLSVSVVLKREAESLKYGVGLLDSTAPVPALPRD